MSTVNGFECRRCGNCCRHPGYVRLGSDEVSRIAELLGMDIYAFTSAYTRLTRERGELSLNESEDGSCVFLSVDNQCAIQDAKPRQCRAFPQHWRYGNMECTCEGVRHERQCLSTATA